MKKWSKPELKQMNINETAIPVDTTDMTSGQMAQVDLGTCNNPYWEGNGKTLEEATEENPYWGGSWGN